MTHHQRKRRSLYITVFSAALILGITLIFNFRKPDCVSAQTCVQIPPSPQVYYWWSSAYTWPNNQGCTTRTMLSNTGFSFPMVNNPRNFVVALTGWDLEFTDNDHHVRRARVWITNQTASGNRVSVTVNACLHDQDPDDPHLFQAYFVTYAWP